MDSIITSSSMNLPASVVLPLTGGLLLHLSTSSFLTLTGRILGISGILDGAVFEQDKWKWASLAGLALAPIINEAIGLYGIAPQTVGIGRNAGLGAVALAGLLVGLGSRLGSGCTSGHFLCGFSRFSKRSVAATLIFFPTAVAVGNLVSPIVPMTSNPLKLMASSTLNDSQLVRLAALVAASVAAMRLIPLSTGSKIISAFLSSYVFATGLTLSGMSNPSTVLGFFRFPPFTADFSNWDPSLLYLAITGLGGNAVHWFLRARHRSKPEIKSEKWQVPTRRDIDVKLVLGALTFGIGWGLMGVCPGPWIVSMSEALIGQRSGLDKLLAFGISMFSGMAVSRML